MIIVLRVQPDGATTLYTRDTLARTPNAALDNLDPDALVRHGYEGHLFIAFDADTNNRPRARRVLPPPPTPRATWEVC